jgi:hypothetical protein
MINVQVSGMYMFEYLFIGLTQPIYLVITTLNFTRDCGDYSGDRMS